MGGCLASGYALSRRKPVPQAHLDDTVSLTDPAIFGCNAVGIHLQGTGINGALAPSTKVPVW